MQRPPLLTTEYHQLAGVYTFTPLKGFPGTGILSYPQSLRSTSLPTPIRPAISPILNPIIFAPTSLKSPHKGKCKPTTVREMLKSKKKMQMERQALEAYQTAQTSSRAPATVVVHDAPVSLAAVKPNGLSGRRKGGSMTKGTIAEDKKVMHRVNERHRHQNMNQAICELVSILPKNSAPETETKQFVLQKANDYLTYLKDKIATVCDDMSVVSKHSDEGLLSFDIPFERNTGKQIIKVPSSNPIQYSDLQSLLGPTSSLKPSEPSKCKPKPVKKTKPHDASTQQHHQPWLEININVRVSPKKKKSAKALSTLTRPKYATKKTSSSSKKVYTKKKCSEKHSRNAGFTTEHHQGHNYASFFQGQDGGQSSSSISTIPSFAGLSRSNINTPSSVGVYQCYSSTNTPSNDSISAHQSSINTPSSIGIYQSQSSINTPSVSTPSSIVVTESQSVVNTPSNASFYQSQLNVDTPSSMDINECQSNVNSPPSDGIYQSQSSINHSSGVGVNESLSSIKTQSDLSINSPSQPEFVIPECYITDSSSPNEYIDLTCADALSPDEDDSDQASCETSITNKEVHLPTWNNVTGDHSDGTMGTLPLICYGSSTFLSDDLFGSESSQLQTDHSYSARVLSQEILQTISSLHLQNLPTDTDTEPQLTYRRVLSREDKDSAKPKSSTTRKASPIYEDPPPEAVLKAAVLQEPPPDCVPPGFRSKTDVDTIKAFGLDFEDDNNSSLCSFSRQSSPELQIFNFGGGVENVDTVFASFSAQNSSMRRSWINGYQLFTKINHQRIRGSWPSLQGREVTRLLGVSWKDLPDTYKQLYSVRACEWNKWYREMRDVARTNDC